MDWFVSVVYALIINVLIGWLVFDNIKYRLRDYYNNQKE